MSSRANTNHHLQLVRQTVGELERRDYISPLALYIAQLAESARRTMMTCLRRAARLWGAPSTDSIEWHLMRFPHVELLKESMQRARLAPATINVTLCALRGVAREAWRLKLLDSEDYQRIAAVKGVRGDRVKAGRALDVDELAALLDACRQDMTPAGTRDACLIALLAGAGLRRTEAVSLQLSDYSVGLHRLRVKGKGGRERFVYLEDGGSRRAIASWIKVRGNCENALLMPITKAGEIKHHPITAGAIYKVLEKRAREAGLRRHISPHDLRRTFASELLDHGADISAVQQLLGHASVETTVIYDRRGEQAKRKALKGYTLPWRLTRRRRKSRKKKHRYNK